MSESGIVIHLGNKIYVDGNPNLTVEIATMIRRKPGGDAWDLTGLLREKGRRGKHPPRCEGILNTATKKGSISIIPEKARRR